MKVRRKRKMNNQRVCFLAAIVSLAGFQSFAQIRIDSMTTFNVGQFQTVVMDATKFSENPVVTDSTSKIAVKKYGITSSRVNTKFEVEPITAAQMNGEPLTKLYNGLAKVGFGTYTTPYAEVWFNQLRSKEYASGLRLKHLSSTSTLEDYGNSSFSDNEISLYGKKFLKEHTLLGNFDYARNVVHFYGYDPELHELDKDLTVQRFNLFAANAELMSHYTKEERYNHDIKLSYYNLADLYRSSENNIRANGFVRKAIGKEMLHVNAGVDFYNYKTKNDTLNNTIITLNPRFIADGKRHKIVLGVSATIDMMEETKFYFHPDLELSYNVFDEIIIPYAGLRGRLQKNSMRSLTNDNPFLNSELDLMNTNQKYEFYGGLKGTLSSSIAYNASAGYGAITDFAMYVNDNSDLLKNRFDVIYDNAELLKVSGEVTYQDREKLRIYLRGDYFNYKMDTEIRAWYTPQLKMSMGANYNLRDKIVVKADLFYIDAQYARITESVGSDGKPVYAAEELKGIFDANLGLEYRYNKKLGFFLNLNNIANVRYYRFSNYPQQRFNLMAGLSYSF
jgi:hypothetical protein